MCVWSRNHKRICIKNRFHHVALPGTGYNPSQELGGKRDWTFSKGCAEPFRFSISSKAYFKRKIMSTEITKMSIITMSLIDNITDTCLKLGTNFLHQLNKSSRLRSIFTWFWVKPIPWARINIKCSCVTSNAVCIPFQCHHIQVNQIPDKPEVIKISSNVIRLLTRAKIMW